jgi:hypothetical protein
LVLFSVLFRVCCHKQRCLLPFCSVVLCFCFRLFQSARSIFLYGQFLHSNSSESL